MENKFECKADGCGYCKKWLRACVGWIHCDLSGYGAPCPGCINSSPLENPACDTCKFKNWKKENYIE